MNKIKIRKATLEDFKDILHLNYLLFKEDYKYDKTLNMKWTYSKVGKDYFKKRIIKSNGCSLVVETRHKIIGYLVGALQEREPYRIKAKYTELENMFIQEKYRRQGIGTKLVQEFLSWCENRQVNCVFVSAKGKNKLGVKFYKKHDFKDYNLTLIKKLE